MIQNISLAVIAIALAVIAGTSVYNSGKHDRLCDEVLSMKGYDPDIYPERFNNMHLECRYELEVN